MPFKLILAQWPKATNFVLGHLKSRDNLLSESLITEKQLDLQPLNLTLNLGVDAYVLCKV